MNALELSGDRVRLEAYTNGGARSTVAVFEITQEGEQFRGTDSINLARGTERTRWIASLPESLREEAATLAEQLGLEIERGRAAPPAKDKAVPFAPIDPWPDPVDVSELLDALRQLIATYVVLPLHGVTVLVLWLLHTYVADVADYTPYIHLTSPVRGCGKSTVEDLLEQLAHRACKSDGITAAALYRRIDRLSPTMLLDELDTRLNGESGELLRGVLDSGFHRNGRQTICVGDDHEERDFKTFCPKALAGIGRLWDTVASRAIAIRMQKASRAELTPLQKIRGDRIAGICEPYRRKLQRWATDSRSSLTDVDPDVPPTLEARQADVWRPLFAIADLASEAWQRAARDAALALSGVSADEGDHALLLLRDVRDLFGAKAVGDDKLASAMIAQELAKREDRPWPEYRKDKPITPRQIATLLGRFDIKPRNIRLLNDSIIKGYRFADCLQAFDRYLQIPASCNATSATSSANEAPDNQFALVVADVAVTAGGTGGDYEADEREAMRDA